MSGASRRTTSPWIGCPSRRTKTPNEALHLTRRACRLSQVMNRDDMAKGMQPDLPSFREKTLTELEGEDWGPPTYDSHLVTTVHRLRHVPLKRFCIEDLRIVIGQKIGLPWLVPLALNHLEKHPFAAGDYYRGDLLKH